MAHSQFTRAVIRETGLLAVYCELVQYLQDCHWTNHKTDRLYDTLDGVFGTAGPKEDSRACIRI
jgi:hypothetical protein